MTDDELEQRLRQTFARVADGYPIPPAPALPVRTDRWRPSLVPLLAAAAALVVVVAGIVALAARAPDESVSAGPSADGTAPPSSVPATVGPDGRVVARATDGTLEVVAIVTADDATGLLAVEVELTDGPSSSGIGVSGIGVPAASLAVDACDRPSLHATAGFTLGVTETPPGTMTVVVSSSDCAGGGGRSVLLDLALPPIALYAGPDGPASPALEVAGDARDGLRANGIDGCLAEVLVDWGDRTNPSSVDVPACAGGATSVDVDALPHDYAPGDYVQRITVTTGSQVAFLEQRIAVA